MKNPLRMFSMLAKLFCLFLLTFGVVKSDPIVHSPGGRIAAEKGMDNMGDLKSRQQLLNSILQVNKFNRSIDHCESATVNCLHFPVISRHQTRIAYSISDNQNIIDICSNISESLIFIRTTYITKMVESDVKNIVENFGVGIVVSRNGLAIAPQHIFRPWLYDRKMLALIDLEIVELVPGSARFSAWSAGQQIEKCDDIQIEYKAESAYTHGVNERGLLVLYASEPTKLNNQFNSMYGPVNINEAISDGTDIIVFQLFYKDDEFQALALEKTDVDINPNSKVLVIGFDVTQLQIGKITPLVNIGEVHRVADDLIELQLDLQPGYSGSPVVGPSGNLLGMVIASHKSDSYGIAVSPNIIRKSLSLTNDRIKAQERRLTNEGCGPGTVDGMFDEALWRSLHRANCLYYENQ